MGNFICGFLLKIKHCLVLEAEIWAIFHGCCVAVEKAYHHLVVESNSQGAFDLIDSITISNHHLSPIIDKIEVMVNGGTNVHWSKILRDNNRAIDILVNDSLSLSCNLMFYDSVPPAIPSIILEDSESIAYV